MTGPCAPSRVRATAASGSSALLLGPLGVALVVLFARGHGGDDRLVVDVSAPAPYYGVKTTQRAELMRYHRMLDLVDHASHAALLRDGEIVQG